MQKGRKSKTKMHAQTHAEHWVSSVFCVRFCDLGTKIDENMVPGPIRDQVSVQTPQKIEKSVKKGLDFERGQSPLGGILETFRDFFAGRFLMSFCEVPFSLLGAIWAPKVPKMVPKGRQKL